MTAQTEPAKKAAAAQTEPAKKAAAAQTEPAKKAAAAPRASKLDVVFLVPSQGVERGDQVRVDAETAEQLIANGQARKA